MSKRRATTSASPSKKQKQHSAHDQKRLDSFFINNNNNRFGTATIDKATPATPSSSSNGIIDVDALDDIEYGIPPTNSVEIQAAAPRVANRIKPAPVPISTPKTYEQFPSYGSSFAEDPVFFSLIQPDWPDQCQTPYSFLTDALTQLTATKSRIAIVNILTNTFRLLLRHDPYALRPSLYLLSNTLAPAYQPTELGVGSSVISKAIQEVSGLTPAALKRLYQQSGDPGDVAFMAKSNVRTLVPHPALRVREVYDTLLKIANTKGSGAARSKQGLVKKLLVAARGEESRYLVRTLVQNLRVGAVRTSILTALARATVLTPASSLSSPAPADARIATLIQRAQPLPPAAKKKPVDEARNELVSVLSEAEALVKRVFVQHPNYEDLSAALLEVGLEGLAERVTLTVGIPLHPTLGSPTRSLDEIYDRLGNSEFTAEFKYDGQRAQLHAYREDNGTPVVVKLFSRHLEDMTSKYPDVVHLIHQLFSRDATLRSFIIDAEIVAVDPTNGSLRTFQELSNRARKDVSTENVSVAVAVFVFDLMYFNGSSFLAQPFRTRRSVLHERFPPYLPELDTANGTSSTGHDRHELNSVGLPARLDHVRSVASADGREAVECFWQEAVESRSEGLMIKRVLQLLDSADVIDGDDDEPEDVTLSPRKTKRRRKPLPATYEPDKRTSAWLKLKKDYVDGLGDSLDLIPIGAWHGNGRKAQWWSPVLLAVWDPEAGKPVAVCKCMSGFSDAFYKDMQVRYALGGENCTTTSLWEVEVGGLRPEVYFRPHEIWEIRGADVTISPVSVAARGAVSATRGLSLRFPRFIRIREDKILEHASTPSFLAQIYRAQQGQGKAAGGIDDFELMDLDPAESEVEEDEDLEE